ncbi:MAG: cytochrome c biogenesis protein ResB [Verrucomicrobiota bacterium]
MVIKRLVQFFTSLRLTAVLLAFGIVLVFIGTVAQVDEGLYNAQARYFRQWFVLGVDLFGKRLPVVLPGGYLLGTMLLANLVAAHIYRFQLTTKKIGIQFAHLGIILLLVGQLLTDMLAHETQIRLVEGESKSYSTSAQAFELVFTTDAGGRDEKVVAIPGELLQAGGEIKNENLPFIIRVKEFWKNSEPSFRAPMMKNQPALTTNGIAAGFDFHPVVEAKGTDDRNIPTALVELSGPTGSLGDWFVSGWSGDEAMVEALGASYARSVGPQMAQSIVAKMTVPQAVTVDGRRFSFVLRPRRLYLPFTLTLLKATHTVYPGTDIPKDFRSRVLIQNSQTKENRETEIYMNNPLRYAGLTFYQFQMGAGAEAMAAGQRPSSTLQVVRNPGWVTPYLGCLLVGLGLTIQFLQHLVGFISKRSAR